MRTVLANGAFLGLAVSLAIVLFFGVAGCTGAQVHAAADELERHQDKIDQAEAVADSARQMLETTGLPEDLRARAERALDTAENVLGGLREQTPVLVQQLREAELAEGSTAGNALIAAGRLGATFGGLLPEPVGALVLGLGTVLGGLGTALNRRHVARIAQSIEVAKKTGQGKVDFTDHEIAALVEKIQGPSTTKAVKRAIG